jgi:hypothetical protein
VRRRSSICLGFLLLLSGCERGCLATWIRDRGAASKAAAPPTMLSGIDCPDGLARCVAGAVEVSQVARVPRPCPPSSRPEDCQCPWVAIETCPTGCADEGTAVVVSPAHAAGRVCAPDPLNPPARPVQGISPPPAACETAGYRCLGSLVVACSPAADVRADGADVAPALVGRVYAACVHGCFQEGEALGEDEADPEGATRILCAR